MDSDFWNGFRFLEWIQIFTVILANFGIWLWARSEANSSRRQFNDFIKEMRDEMKDFHYRLLEIERDRK